MFPSQISHFSTDLYKTVPLGIKMWNQNDVLILITVAWYDQKLCPGKGVLLPMQSTKRTDSGLPRIRAACILACSETCTRKTYTFVTSSVGIHNPWYSTFPLSFSLFLFPLFFFSFPFLFLSLYFSLSSFPYHLFLFCFLCPSHSVHDCDCASTLCSVYDMHIP